MRIIGGTFGGRKLISPKGGVTRPTSGRLREALFNILGSIDGLTFLELFAGTGAVGLEALSRGASYVTFVERDRHASQVIRQNLTLLNCESKARLVTRDALAPLPGSFDLIFADPPYSEGIGQRVLTMVDQSTLLTPGGRLFIEESFRSPLATESLAQLELVKERRYGDTTLYEFRKP